MVYLAGVGLSIALVILGIERRRRSGLPVDSDYTAKLVWVALGLGMSLGSLVLPAAWLFVSLSIRGGTVEDNLLPGTDTRFLLAVLVVGTAMTLVYTLFGYRDHVFPYRRIGTDIELRADDVPPGEPGRNP